MNSTKGGAAAIGAREALAGLDIWGSIMRRNRLLTGGMGRSVRVLHSMASAAKD